jgi:hypothetical protein
MPPFYKYFLTGTTTGILGARWGQDCTQHRLQNATHTLDNPAHNRLKQWVQFRVTQIFLEK